MQFSYVRSYFENNNPAFQKIRNDASAYKIYNGRVLRLKNEISKEKSGDRCNIYFDRYLALLKDHHSGIDINLQRLNIDINNQQTLDSFKSTANYRSFKKIAIDTAALLSQLRSKLPSDIEGLYSNGRNIFLGIIKTKPDNYIGVVMRKNKLLDVGHILLELRKISNTRFECVYHTGLLALNFKDVYKNIEIKNGSIPEIDFFKEGVQKIHDKEYSFTELDHTTNYLKLASFDKSLQQELDSFYQSIDSIVQSKPYLIIDLRNNGGGAEACYLSLMKYIYTRPLQVDDIEVWVSPDNIKRYEELAYNPPLIKRMKEAKPFTFIPQVVNGMESWTMEGTTYPKKIAVLYNRKTASSAEGMITYCMQSDKVITVGENSGGFIGYGDVMSATIPCGKFSIRSTTTKYHRNSKYEFVGIKPMYNVSDKQDWVEFARKMLLK